MPDILSQTWTPELAQVYRDPIEALRELPQVPMPVQHRFQDGVYIREIFMPADTWVVGAVHRHRHFNIVVQGRAFVRFGGEEREVKAGDVFESGEAVQKFLYIEEDCRWLTIHANPDNCRDIAALEERLTILDPKFLEQKGSMTLDEFRLRHATLTEHAQ